MCGLEEILCKCGHSQSVHNTQGKCSECDCKDFLKEGELDWLRNPKVIVKLILLLLGIVGAGMLIGAIRGMFGLSYP